jgi:serine/threonine protein kinase
MASMASLNDKEMYATQSQPDRKFERKGSFVGTLNYIPPEMATKQTTTLTMDMWALGCIVYKMITGRAAFPGVANPVVFPLI